MKFFSQLTRNTIEEHNSWTNAHCNLMFYFFPKHRVGYEFENFLGKLTKLQKAPKGILHNTVPLLLF